MQRTIFPSISAQVVRDEAQLSILEVGKQLPFEVRRIYTISDCIPKLERGLHAHKKTVQAIFCVVGSIDLILDDGERKRTYHLSTPSKGMLIAPMVWHVMKNIQKGTVMLVLASHPYKESDYIRSYDAFLRHLQKKRSK